MNGILKGVGEGTAQANSLDGLEVRLADELQRFLQEEVYCVR